MADREVPHPNPNSNSNSNSNSNPIDLNLNPNPVPEIDLNELPEIKESAPNAGQPPLHQMLVDLNEFPTDQESTPNAPGHPSQREMLGQDLTDVPMDQDLVPNNQQLALTYPEDLTLEQMIQLCVKMSDAGQHNTAAFKKLSEKVHHTLWQNLANRDSALVYQPHLPGAAQDLAAATNKLVAVGKISLSAGFQCIQDIHRQALTLGSQLCSIMAQFFFSVSSLKTPHPHFSKFMKYIQETSQNNSDLKVLLKVNAVLTASMKALETYGNMSYTFVHPDEVNKMLPRFERLIWGLQEIFWYPGLPSNITQSSLESSSLINEINQCQKELDEVSENVKNITARSTSQVSAAAMKKLSDTVATLIAQIWG